MGYASVMLSFSILGCKDVSGVVVSDGEVVDGCDADGVLNIA